MSTTTNLLSCGPIRNLFVGSRHQLVKSFTWIKHSCKNVLSLCCHYDCHFGMITECHRSMKTLKIIDLDSILLTLGITNIKTVNVTLGLYSMTLHKTVDCVKRIINACTSSQFFQIITLVLERMTKINLCRYCHYCTWVFLEMESYNIDERRKLRTTTRSRNWWRRRLHPLKVQPQA